MPVMMTSSGGRWRRSVRAFLLPSSNSFDSAKAARLHELDSSIEAPRADGWRVSKIDTLQVYSPAVCF